MITFASNLMLAIIWSMVTGNFSGSNLFFGFLIGFVILRISSPTPTRYHAKAWMAVKFFTFYLKQLIASNLRVAYDVLTPRLHMHPGVVAIPLAARTDAEITLLANLITLTPGTLSLDLSPDRKTLYVHAMYLDDLDAFRFQIKNGLEKRVLELLR